MRNTPELIVVFFGELHNNPISHWMQLEVSKSLLSRNPVFGAEMFEADNQVMMTEYLDGIISSQKLKITSSSARSK